MQLSATPVLTVIYGTPPAGVEHLAAVLDPAAFAVTAEPFTAQVPTPPEGIAFVVIEAGRELLPTVQAVIRRWRAEAGDRYFPVVWLLPERCHDVVAGALDAGADLVFTRPFDLVALMAQFRALARAAQCHQRVAARATESHAINNRLRQAYQQLDNDLELTRRIHRGFLPRALPDVLHTRFAVCYRPRSRMGGDFYDVLRLDEDNVALFVADAMGHGTPASSLLGIYVKKCLTPKEIAGRSYRLIPPDEVLLRLNRELVALGLPEPPFVTMTYVQMNARDGQMSYSRAGHPLPLYVPREGAIEYWHASGPLLGVFEADFANHPAQLKPGDKLLLCSDGVQQHDEKGKPISPDRLLESAYRHRLQPAQAFVDNLARDLLEFTRNSDDFTLLALEYGGIR